MLKLYEVRGHGRLMSWPGHFVLLACVIAVIFQLGKTMMWYDVVLAGLHYQRYQHTEKEALDCSTTGISVKCKSSRANFNVRSLYLCCTSLLSSMQIPA